MIAIGEMDELKCPGCGATFLHHSTIDVYDRSVEDGDDSQTMHVRVADGRVEIDHSNHGNPSDRRDGLRIELWCELCPTRSVLTIAQHKGETHVRFQAQAE